MKISSKISSKLLTILMVVGLSGGVYAEVQQTNASSIEHSSGKKDWCLAGALLGATTADIETTFRCSNCTEANPILAGLNTRSKLYPAQFAADSGIIWLTHRWYKEHRRCWWLPITFMIAGHTLAAIHNSRY